MYTIIIKRHENINWGDQCSVIAVFPLAPDDDDGQFCVRDSRKSP